MATEKIVPAVWQTEEILASTIPSNGSLLENSSTNQNVSTLPDFGHRHHRVVRRDPIFIPAFDKIRKAAIAHAEQDLRQTYQDVQDVEGQIQSANSSARQGPHSGSNGNTQDLQSKRTMLLDRLVKLISTFDKHIAGELKMQQLHNFAYSRRHGLATTDFTLSRSPEHEDCTNSEPWIMLETLEATVEGTLTEDYESDNLDAFAADRSKSSGERHYLRNVYQRRPMTLLERQRGVVMNINGLARPIRSRMMMWLALFVMIAVVLVVFFGVGLIGSTQPFSPYFLRNYFAIAVAWSLISSALLSWYVRLLGGTKSESAASFLAMLAIWLVVIQIGQVRRSIQTDT